MDGPRENAKEKQVGFHLHMSRSKKTYWRLLDLYLTLNPHKICMIIAFSIMWCCQCSFVIFMMLNTKSLIFFLCAEEDLFFFCWVKSKWFVIIIQSVSVLEILNLVCIIPKFIIVIYLVDNINIRFEIVVGVILRYVMAGLSHYPILNFSLSFLFYRVLQPKYL